MSAIERALTAHWKVFRKHIPGGEYLPVGQMDGDCRACGAGWPCAHVLSAIESALDQTIGDLVSEAGRQKRRANKFRDEAEKHARELRTYAETIVPAMKLYQQRAEEFEAKYNELRTRTEEKGL